VRATTIHITVDTVPHIVLSPLFIYSTTGITTIHAPSGFSSYQWLYFNTIIANGISDSILTLAFGPYRVIVRTAGGCIDTSTTSYVREYEGINEIATYHVNMYPNPTDNMIYVDAENLEGISTIEVADNLGRTISSNTISGTSIHAPVDMSALSAGMYMVLLRDANAVIAVRKVIKN
jgi:hypothetical protein